MTTVSVKDKKHADLSDSVLTSSLFTSLLASAIATAGAIRNQRGPVINKKASKMRASRPTLKRTLTKETLQIY